MKTRSSTVLCILAITGLAVCQTHRIPAVLIPDNSTCPSDVELDVVRAELYRNISDILLEIAADKTNNHTIEECEGSGWRRVALLDMTGPSQSCPDQWRLYDLPDSQIRACGRLESSVSSCDSVRFATNGYSYSEVCGRIVGYQYASPDGLYLFQHLRDIDAPYVDGVSITHGNPRQHIWTFYGAVREFAFGCCNTYSTADFVGSDYFCDTGNPENSVWRDVFFTEQPLWDGMAGCGSNASCCAPSAGPWFHTHLAAAIDDDIEVRICGGEPSSNEDTPLKLIEIYIRK